MACTSEDDPAHPAESASLHITSVTIDGGSPATRAVYEETATHTYLYNLTITALEVGDKLKMEYNFKGGYDESNILTASLVKTATGWDIQDKDGTSITIRPAEGEKWEDLYIGWVDMTNGDVYGNESQYSTVAPAMGVVQGTVPQADSYLFGDWVSATSNAEYIANYGAGTVTVDTDLNSPTLGAMTINLKHSLSALLRLPMEDAKVAEGTYLVGGKEYTNPTLATLWAVCYNGSTNSYFPLTKVTIGSTDYLQAIIDTGGTCKLTGFKAVMQSGDDTFTLDLPFQVGTGTEATTAYILQSNTRYPLTLSISPSTASVTQTSADTKPGWGEEDEI